MNFYETLEVILTIQDPKRKIVAFKQFYEAYKNNDFIMISHPKKTFNEPSYAHICQIVAPQNVPKRKNLTTCEGQIIFIHAIAHIEYSAIDLALDAAYRFENMPKAYYDDWLSVAHDEIRHFEMLEKILQQLDSHYGAIEVHNALFEALARTENSFLERMAVVPRYLEANGLDATPEILLKLKRLPKSDILNTIIETLEVILLEEVDHVKKGDIWFEYACQELNVPKAIYFEIIEKYYPLTFTKQRHLNVAARRQAGFSCDELEKIVNKVVCS